MGLDMYLKAEKYFSGYQHTDAGDAKEYRAILNAAGIEQPPCESTPSLTLSVTVAYWRKANAIHGWFVREVQDGKDECQPMEVTCDKFVELRNLCALLLKSRDIEEAEEKLPPQQGFFFGSTAIDEYYWKDLDDTVKQLDKVLTLPLKGHWGFIYQSSW